MHNCISKYPDSSLHNRNKEGVDISVELSRQRPCCYCFRCGYLVALNPSFFLSLCPGHITHLQFYEPHICTSGRNRRKIMLFFHNFTDYFHIGQCPSYAKYLSQIKISGSNLHLLVVVDVCILVSWHIECPYYSLT